MIVYRQVACPFAGPCDDDDDKLGCLFTLSEPTFLGLGELFTLCVDGGAGARGRHHHRVSSRLAVRDGDASSGGKGTGQNNAHIEGKLVVVDSCIIYHHTVRLDHVTMSGEDPSFVGDHQRPLLSTSSPSSPTSPVSSLDPSRSPSAVTRSLSGGGSSNQYLGTGSGSAAHGTSSGRSRLGARRLNSGNLGGNNNGGGGGGMSEKARGKQPASSANKSTLPEEQRETSGGHTIDMDSAEAVEEEPGRPVVIRFSGYPSVSSAGRPADGDDSKGAGAGPVAEEDSGKDLDVWIDHGESVGRVKDKVSEQPSTSW